jgi:hypothetical protein
MLANGLVNNNQRLSARQAQSAKTWLDAKCRGAKLTSTDAELEQHYFDIGATFAILLNSFA